MNEKERWTEWMNVLLARASDNGDSGEVPVAAVIRQRSDSQPERQPGAVQPGWAVRFASPSAG